LRSSARSHTDRRNRVTERKLGSEIHVREVTVSGWRGQNAVVPGLMRWSLSSTLSWTETLMSPSARRMDPYKSFKFRIMWDGEYIAGASLITGLEPSSVADLDAAGSPATSSTSQSSLRA
jgi:hypothetical protein